MALIDNIVHSSWSIDRLLCPLLPLSSLLRGCCKYCITASRERFIDSDNPRRCLDDPPPLAIDSLSLLSANASINDAYIVLNDVLLVNCTNRS